MLLNPGPPTVAMCTECYHFMGHEAQPRWVHGVMQQCGCWVCTEPAVKKKTLQQRDDSDGDSSHPMRRQSYSDGKFKKKAAAKKKPAVKKPAVKSAPACLKKPVCLGPKEAAVKKKPACMQASSSKNPITQKKKPASMQAFTSESELNSPIKHRRTTKKPATTSRTSAAQGRITEKKPAASPVDPYWPRTSDRQ